MKKLNTSPISGMQELLPKEQAVFNKFKDCVREVYKHRGFLEIETPVIDRAEILFAKAGGETEKQIYKVVKTEEAAEGADQALRFDHTVPLARYIVEHESDLAFPFRVTQIGRNYRGERAQKGRFREFYQADIDVLGRNELAIEYDAEVILTLSEALDALHLPPKLVRVSNRKILVGFLEELNLQEVASEIFSIVDHAEKVPLEKTKEWLAELSIGNERVDSVMNFIDIAGDATCADTVLWDQLAVFLDNMHFLLSLKHFNALFLQLIKCFLVSGAVVGFSRRLSRFAVCLHKFEHVVGKQFLGKLVANVDLSSSIC